MKELNFRSFTKSMLDGYWLGLPAKNEASGNGDLSYFQIASETLRSPKTEEKIADLFENAEFGPAFIEKVDEFIDENEELEDLREYFIDLATLRLIDKGTEKMGMDYLESEEWIEVEDASLDRGTELLNIIVYLKDCLENKVKPDLQDFLNEFLLIEDDDFQDEFFIYEPLIKNQAVLEGTLKDIVEAGNEIFDSEMRGLFTPMMLFFREVETKPGNITLAILKYSELPAVHSAIYSLLCNLSN